MQASLTLFPVLYLQVVCTKQKSPQQEGLMTMAKEEMML